MDIEPDAGRSTNDTDVTPNQGTTAGSSSISSGGKQIRAAAAAAYQALLGLASTQLGVSVGKPHRRQGRRQRRRQDADLRPAARRQALQRRDRAAVQPRPDAAAHRVAAQSVASPGSGSSQGLAATEMLPTPAFVPSPGPGLSPGAPGTKPVSQYKLVGIAPSPPRVDIPAKVTGQATRTSRTSASPGMLHGRVVRPRGQGAYGDGTSPKVLSVDESSIAHIPDVADRAEGQLPRRGRERRVRRDPGGGRS